MHMPVYVDLALLYPCRFRWRESLMTYQVLARKWRPKTFREMAGQNHVLKALVNALDHDRLHHAYLFTGTRGVGKTRCRAVCKWEYLAPR